jgi:hypothetical protein
MLPRLSRVLVVSTCILMHSVCIHAAQRSLEQITQDNKGAIVFLSTKVTLPTGEVKEFTGTGFLLNEKGYVLSASHVLSEGGVYDKAEVLGSPLTRYGHLWPLDVIIDDHSADLLLLKFKDVGVKWASVTLGAPDEVVEGGTLYVLGFPMSYDLGVKRGELSNKSGPGASWITTVPLNHGDSGAPVFDSDGRVVALVVSGVSNANGIAFCLPLNFALRHVQIAGVTLPVPAPAGWARSPQPLSPPDGAVLTNSPRRLRLQWTEVANARSYRVQLQVQDPIDSSWFPHPRALGERVVSSTRFNLEFIGSQPGRWRVAAIGSQGEEGEYSAWSYFAFEDSTAPIPGTEGLPFSPTVTLRYTYKHEGNQCDGHFFGDGLGRWAEVTLGDNDCVETYYSFQQESREGDIVLLHDLGRGYYVQLPLSGGWATLGTSENGPFVNIHHVERVGDQSIDDEQSTAPAASVDLLKEEKENRLTTYTFSKEAVLGEASLVRVPSKITLEHSRGQNNTRINLILDLSDLQKNAPELVDATALPTDSCARPGENIVARIWRNEITIENDLASIAIDGDIEIWTCLEVLGSQIKTRVAEQHFRVGLPFRFVKSLTNKVDLVLEDRMITLSGNLTGVTEGVLKDRILPDLAAEARSSLGRIIKPDICKSVLPVTLAELNPTLSQVRLLSDSGNLAAICEMRINGNDETTARLVQTLRNGESGLE